MTDATQPEARSTKQDLALLRRFEPVIRYTRGERFFPLSAGRYVDVCSLWIQRADQAPECLIPAGELTLDRLGQSASDGFESIYYLRLEDSSLDEPAHAEASLHLPDEPFRAGRGRLARVGYASRFIDAAFSLSLLARGRVAADRASAAAAIYRRLLECKECYRYHGRVIHSNGWIVLQYWYLYLYNNWRSGFSGANDHEADWEMVNIYLVEQEGKITPEWVAYASHDHEGDDLRRRWDDPELETIDEHPVIYAGAGSHASYFSQGEYLTELELPLLSPLVRISDRLRDVWHEQLRQYRPTDLPEQHEDAHTTSNLFRIPFVDYARGDGIAIGPGQDREWAEPVFLSPTPGWTVRYRGLWGLLTRDPFSSEDAPAGPMYRRDGSVRRAWYDPVGWSGLDKVPPPTLEVDLVGLRQTELHQRDEELQAQIEEKSAELVRLGIDEAAMRGESHLHTLHEEHLERIEELSEEIDRLRAEQAQDWALLESLDEYASELRAGLRPPARAHIRRPHRPTTRQELRMGRVAEFWAAISVSVMLLIFVWLVTTRQEFIIQGLILLLSLFVFIEASFRGRLIRLVTSVTLALTLVTSLILIYEFFWQIVIVLVFAMGLYILWENVHELWR